MYDHSTMNIMMQLLIKSLLGFAFLGIWASCNEISVGEYDNPLDPESESYIPPNAQIESGPQNGQVLSDHEVRFTWTGNAPKGQSHYKYMLKGPKEISENWTTKTQTTLSYLDEGEYSFKLLEKYSSSDIQEDTTKRSFIIDAIDGPAFRMEPFHLQVKEDERFDIKVIAEEVEDFYGAHLSISYNENYLKWEGIEKNTSCFGLSQGEIIMLDQKDGNQLTVDFTILQSDSNQGLRGTDRLFTLSFLSEYQGEIYIDFNDGQCKMRNSLNEEIFVNQMLDCRIIIE